MMMATNEAGVATSDGKMIDQGIAYLLMMLASEAHRLGQQSICLRIKPYHFHFYSSPYGVHSISLMASIKVSVLILTYALIAVLLHPLVCQGRTTTTKAMTTIEGAATNDGKTIDQGIAYILMVTALLVTYLIH
ncbi:hypothetical protein ZIOFF_045158 [Zingiber officinale]|uniref:Uncharacterized protein n=1 Tax=Zingiber officinale TaxID=94328 RepID=A0A8J5L0T0_ZINOF|nr:hypothetical protein ZIOFF_045158 [Zingiber officinale]